MNRSIMLTAFAVALAAAGCDGVVVYEPIDNDNYYQGSWEYATQSGEIRTEVHGDPFGEPTEEFADHVMQDLHGATRGQEITFTKSPAQQRDAFKVVAVFNGAREREASPCDGVVDDPRAARTPTRMHLVFCQGDKMLSEASGKVNGVTSSTDPRFRELVQKVALGMLPPLDTIDYGDGDRVQP